ncbi:MAG: hypothetical protein E7485_00615 [Ruminococcaceae bacterium]|nr:hypothetical protein [Oscillospiraceae bacterium]
MDNIEDILRALAEDDEEQPESSSDSENSGTDGGIFGGLDPNMLLTIMELFEKMKKQDDSERLLLSLKPLLREENQSKIDTALKFMKLFALLPILKDSGMLGKLF